MSKVVNVFGCVFIGLLGVICCASLVGILLNISFDGFKYDVMDCLMTFLSSFVLMGLVGYVWIGIIHPEYFDCPTDRKEN